MLCEIYEVKPTDLKMKAYFLVLSNMSEEDFKNSIISILKTRKFATLPKPAEILEYIKPDVEKVSVIVIDDIERAIRRAGAYGSITFEDKVVNSIIDHLGGWIKVCRMDETEWKWSKKDIKRLYETYSKSASHPNHLIGISENENGFTKKINVVKAGYEIKSVDAVPALNPSMTAIVSLAKTKCAVMEVA